MRGIRVALVVAIVVAILAYLAVLVSGGGLGRRDGFTGVGPSENVFTLFYMNGCPHCDDVLPEFNQWAAAGQIMANGKPVKIRKLEQKEAGPLLNEKNVEGFPTFILTTASGQDIEYKGDREPGAYQKFILSNVK